MTMQTDSTTVRSEALARASALATRAKELRNAQHAVQEMTAREVQVLAHTAATFFETIPLPEFSPLLLPHHARGVRNIRHRIVHRTATDTTTGTIVRALLLGRDGTLRLFTARSPLSRDLLVALDPGRALPNAVLREVVDWSPMLRIPDFRPFEILDKLSQSLDAVEQRITNAEARVKAQRAALDSGDLSSLRPARTTPRSKPVERNERDATDSLVALAAPLMIPAHPTETNLKVIPAPPEPEAADPSIPSPDDSWDWDAVEAMHERD